MYQGSCTAIYPVFGIDAIPQMGFKFWDDERMSRIRDKSPEQILADNLNALIGSHPHFNSTLKVAKQAGIGNGTVDRARRAEVSLGIDKVYALAKVFGVRPEQLLIDGEAPQETVVDDVSAEVGSKAQLNADWNALPSDWQYYLCHKARELREISDNLPGIIKQSMRPIKDEENYRNWEERIETALRNGELLDFTMEMRRPDLVAVQGGKKTGGGK